MTSKTAKCNNIGMFFWGGIVGIATNITEQFKLRQFVEGSIIRLEDIVRVNGETN
jgi:hypothetical protein